MSVLIFAADGSNQGRVAVMEQPGAFGDFMRVQNWRGAASQKSIFTRIGFAGEENTQYQHTLGDSLYVYTFGGRIGTMELSGISFRDMCDGEEEHGIANVIQYYHRNKISRLRDVLRITIAPDSVFECFLQGIRGDMVDPSLQIFQFSLSLALIP